MRDLFAAEYLKDFNATQAAIRAGYSRRTAASQGQRLLKSAAVGNAIAQAQARLLKKADVSVENVMKEIANIAFLDPGQLVDERGALLPINQMPEEVRRGLTRLEIKELFDYDRGKTHIGRRYKLGFTGKIEALAILERYLHLFPQTSEVAGKDRKPPAPAEHRGPPLDATHISEGSTSGILAPSKPPPP